MWSSKYINSFNDCYSEIWHQCVFDAKNKYSVSGAHIIKFSLINWQASWFKTDSVYFLNIYKLTMEKQKTLDGLCWYVFSLFLSIPIYFLSMYNGEKVFTLQTSPTKHFCSCGHFKLIML